MISVISSFEIINVVIHNVTVFFWIAASVADAAAVNGIKKLLANDLSLTKNPSDYLILCNWLLNNFIFRDELFAKAFNKVFKVALSSLRPFLATKNLKILLILNIFKFLSWFFGHAGKKLAWKVKVNFKTYDVTTWLTINCNTHIDQYRKK